MRKLKRKILSEASYQRGKYLLPPEFVSLVITDRCNFRCQACSIWKKNRQAEMGTEEWPRISDQLKDILPPDAFVEINGGEPLLRLELAVSLISDLKKYFRSVTLNSNGSLINQESLAELEKSGLDTIKLSLYSLEAKIHDDLRGFPGVHAQALSALQLVGQSRVKTEVGILITRKNIAGLPELLGYIKGIENATAILQPLDEDIGSAEAKDTRSNRISSELWPEREAAAEFFDWISENADLVKNPSPAIRAMREYYLVPSSVMKYRCFAGQRSMIIDPQGNVSFCFKRQSIGSAANDNLGYILRHPKANAERLAIKKCGKYCRIIGCNFSRGFREYFQDLF